MLIMHFVFVFFSIVYCSIYPHFADDWFI